jgi:hypothetical protein
MKKFFAITALATAMGAISCNTHKFQTDASGVFESWTYRRATH